MLCRTTQQPIRIGFYSTRLTRGSNIFCFTLAAFYSSSKLNENTFSAVEPNSYESSQRRLALCFILTFPFMRERLLPMFLLLLSPMSLWAWGVDGHRAVGKIAEQHLTRKARLEVQRLLGTETLTLVSTWPDEIRNYPEFKDTAPWHYVNLPSGLNETQYVQALKDQTQPNAYNILQAKLHDLTDPAKTQAEKIAALKFIVHIVGDAHQPLHTGHAEDKGGNDIKLKYRGKDTNLHSLWDSGLIDYQGLTYTEMAAQYTYKLPSRQVRNWQAATPEQWFWESYQASEQIYKDVPAGANNAEAPGDIDYKYYPAHSELMKRRIQQAGVRLAGLLNEALG